jgi:hypothetical protein
MVACNGLGPATTFPTDRSRQTSEDPHQEGASLGACRRLAETRAGGLARIVDPLTPPTGCEIRVWESKWDRSGGARKRRKGKRQWRNPAMVSAFALVGRGSRVVELRGFEPRTFSLRRRVRPHRSPVYALHELRADRQGVDDA